MLIVVFIHDLLMNLLFMIYLCKYMFQHAKGLRILEFSSQ